MKKWQQKIVKKLKLKLQKKILTKKKILNNHKRMSFNKFLINKVSNQLNDVEYSYMYE